MDTGITERPSSSTGEKLGEIDEPVEMHTPDHGFADRQESPKSESQLDRHGTEPLSDQPPVSARIQRGTGAPIQSPFKDAYIISHLIVFSILGTLARVGLQWLTFYPGAPVTTSVLWANVGGSFVMGFLSVDRRLFQLPAHLQKANMTESDAKTAYVKHKKTIPLFIGLATGFCGSFTSFSSFIRDAFFALSNDLPTPYSHPIPAPAPAFSSTYPRNAGYSVLSSLAILLIQPGMSLAALYVGGHVASALTSLIPSTRAPSLRTIDLAILVLGPLAWLAVVLLAILTPEKRWRGEILFALVFAPLGAVLRFYASLHLNPRIKSFPLGTFAVNVIGTVILGMAYDLQRVRIGAFAGGGVVGCQVLQGVQDGFCGCLTTVSTWVAELQGLRRRHAYVYGITSMAVGLISLVIIMGSVRWTVGWMETVCATGRTSS